MPSSADSRVIVPPAPIVRSTVARSVLPSTGRSGIDDARPPVAGCLLGGSGQEHHLACLGEDVLENRVEPRVPLAVVESPFRRRAHRGRHAVGVEAQRYEDRRVRSDVREVQLLLEALRSERSSSATLRTCGGSPRERSPERSLAARAGSSGDSPAGARSPSSSPPARGRVARRRSARRSRARAPRRDDSSWRSATGRPSGR